MSLNPNLVPSLPLQPPIDPSKPAHVASGARTSATDQTKPKLSHRAVGHSSDLITDESKDIHGNVITHSEPEISIELMYVFH